MKKALWHIVFISFALTQMQAQDSSYIDTKAIQAIGIFNLKTINTKASEFAPSFYTNGIIYVGMPASINQGKKGKKKSYYNLYFAPVNAFGIPNGTPEELSALNSPFHEGPVCFDERTGTLYFTRTNADDWKTRSDTDLDVHLQIYSSVIIDGKWSEPIKLSINSDDYSICHPSLSKDGTRLYFASNMEGGYGGMDIYYSNKDGDTWSVPINAGSTVNSIHNDWFPFIHDSGHLFFCSDGHGGYGGLDIFICYNRAGDFSAPENLGKKLNSSADQAGFVLSANGMRGYFASEDSTKGNDELYLFDTKLPILANFKKPTPTMMESLVQLRMKGALRGIEGVNIKVYDFIKYKTDQASAFIGEQRTDLNGYTAFEFKEGQKLLFQTELNSKMSDEWVKTASELIRLDMDPKEENENEIEDIPTNIRTATITSGAVISLDNIYYDYNKAEIKPGAAEELEILAKIMQDYPVITIILTAHTDSRGTELFNQKLSEERAATAKAYLLKKGIDGSRISILGMGESRLRNHCADGVECSESEHQYNRRTEVRIVTAPAGIEIKYQE
jgi:outer membrane protein OmpA-like peptidoglycan-associated protein